LLVVGLVGLGAAVVAVLVATKQAVKVLFREVMQL